MNNDKVKYKGKFILAGDSYNGRLYPKDVLDQITNKMQVICEKLLFEEEVETHSSPNDSKVDSEEETW